MPNCQLGTKVSRPASKWSWLVSQLMSQSEQISVLRMINYGVLRWLVTRRSAVTSHSLSQDFLIRHQLENCPQLSIEVPLTTFRPWLLTFNPRIAMVMTHTHAKGQCQRSLGSKVRVETIRWTDGRRTEAIVVTWLVNITQSLHIGYNYFMLIIEATYVSQHLQLRNKGFVICSSSFTNHTADGYKMENAIEYVTCSLKHGLLTIQQRQQTCS